MRVVHNVFFIRLHTREILRPSISVKSFWVLASSSIECSVQQVFIGIFPRSNDLQRVLGHICCDFIRIVLCIVNDCISLVFDTAQNKVQ